MPAIATSWQQFSRLFSPNGHQYRCSSDSFPFDYYFVVPFRYSVDFCSHVASNSCHFIFCPLSVFLRLVLGVDLLIGFVMVISPAVSWGPFCFPMDLRFVSSSFLFQVRFFLAFTFLLISYWVASPFPSW
jgi:hypothetical protein